jgi:NAD+ kinase
MRAETLDASPRSARPISSVGIVIHPVRDVGQPLGDLRAWAKRRDVELGQVHVNGRQPEVARERDPDACDLLVAIGGDGTTLAAVHAAAATRRPVLGVACGSLGVLTTVAADAVPVALERVASGDWVPRGLPALEARREEGTPLHAFNDVAVVRSGEGQIRSHAHVDGELFGRFAGDGAVVSTAIGSSAYTLAAGGPLLMPDIDAFVLTPLPTHGGFSPPLVLRSSSELRLDCVAGHGGARLEIDGQVVHSSLAPLTIRLRPALATIVSFPGQESLFAALRRRQIIFDSPRILADEKRLGAGREDGC